MDRQIDRFPHVLLVLQVAQLIQLGDFEEVHQLGPLSAAHSDVVVVGAEKAAELLTDQKR